MARGALLIIDMINPLDFKEGIKLLKAAIPAAKAIRRLKQRFRKNNWPVVYVNDHYGQWKSSWKDLYEACTKNSRGKELGEILKPEERDYFILKPKHSAFFSTNLEILLDELKVTELVITGIAGNICVLFTVNDAHMRGYKVRAPRNAIASNTIEENRFALKLIKRTLGVDTRPL